MMLLFGRLGKAVLRDCGIFWVSVIFSYDMVLCSDASIDFFFFFFFFFVRGGGGGGGRRAGDQYLSTLLLLFPCFCFHVFFVFLFNLYHSLG